MNLKSLIPATNWIRHYQRAHIRGDLIAGLTVGIMLVPQGMAYAMLAGLPPVYGLYASLLPLLLYPFWGSSPYLSVGPVALVSIIVLSGLTPYAEPMSEPFIRLALLTALVAGAIQVLLGLLRMGFLVNFLSLPVLSGFTTAAAVIIALSQVKYLFGVEIAGNLRPYETLFELGGQLDQINPYSLLIGLGGFVIIWGLRKIRKSLPGALLVVGLGIGLMLLTGWEAQGVAIIGSVPSGLPAFDFSWFSWAELEIVTPLALIICLISFIESLAIAKSLGAKNGHFHLDANRELLGLGLAKLGGAFFQAFPNTGSFSRSAINEQSGAKTGLSSLIAGTFVALTLMFFTQAFFYLPQAILAAIVLSAVMGLIDYKEAIRLYKKDKRDFYTLLVTFGLTLALGIQQGVLAGVLLSLLFVLIQVSKPHYAVLGKLPHSGVYRNLDRYQEAYVSPQLLIMRYDQDIFFGNAEHFLRSVYQEIEAKPTTKYLVLDMSSVSRIDSTGLAHLQRLHAILADKGIAIHLSGLKGPVRDIVARNELDQEWGQNHFHVNIDAAIKRIIPPVPVSMGA